MCLLLPIAQVEICLDNKLLATKMERVESYIFFIRDAISDELLRNLTDTSVEFDCEKEPNVVYLNCTMEEYDDYIMSKDYVREAYFVYDRGDLFRCVLAPKTYKDSTRDKPDFMCDLHGIAYMMYTIGVSSMTLVQCHREYTVDGYFVPPKS
jgi:hypothetical protein